MGTFHQDRGELHGITVVVDTPGPRVYVGRCDTIDARGIVLLDADLHEDGTGGRGKQEWIRRAAMVGVWARHPRLVVPMDEVASIRRLGEVD
jgi:hypothetical protein